MNRAALALIAALFASPLCAEAPDRSLRPQARPATQDGAPAPVQTVRDNTTQIGRICRDRRIQGTRIGSVPGEQAGCGVENAVRVVSVSGVALSQPAVMECDMARALNRWVRTGMKRAIRRKGGGVVELQVAAHYACRTRNSQAGARISEHGKGRAIDISAFRLRDGTTIAVETGWPDRRQGRILRRVHKSACKVFGTVLGPESDRFHQDHFHFDIAEYRNGSYCR